MWSVSEFIINSNSNNNCTALPASHRCTTHCGGRGVRKTELAQVAVSVLQRPFVTTDSSVLKEIAHSVTVTLVRMTLN